MIFRHLLESIIGCTHERLSMPRSLARDANPQVTCLDCGRQWRYDWATMRRGEEIRDAAQPKTWESVRARD